MCERARASADICFRPPPPRSCIMHDCSEQINFQSRSLQKRDFIYLCSDIIPDVATVTASETAAQKRECIWSRADGRRRVYMCVCSHSFLTEPSPPTSLFPSCLLPPLSWISASSIWSRLWPCGVPGSRTSAAEATLSTDELSEHAPKSTGVIPT